MISAEQFTSYGYPIIPATGTHATGLLAPLMRASGHILYALAAASASPPLITSLEIQDEVAAASAHLSATITLQANVLSVEAYDRINGLRTLTGDASANCGGWANEDLPRCLLHLVNNYMALAVFLDRELAGIGHFESDAGSSL